MKEHADRHGEFIEYRTFDTDVERLIRKLRVSAQQVPQAKIQPESPISDGQYSDEQSLDDIRKEIAVGHHHGVLEYGVRWGVSRGEASKRITLFSERGDIVCSRRGKRKLVTEASMRK